VSINVNATNPVLTALQDLNSGAADAALLGGRDATAASKSAASGAVTIGQNGSLDLTALDADTMSLNRAASIADLAVGAGATVAGLLNSLKTQASAAQDPSLDPSARQALNADFKSVLGQIASTLSEASFDGVNLLDGGSTGAAGSMSLTAQNLSLGGAIVTVAPTSSLGTATAAASALGEIGDSLTNIQAALNALSDQASQVSAHGSILSQLSGALQAAAAANGGAGADGARLLALQVQQGLGAQAQPIANQSPQMVLSLFR
jgi:flagellin